MKNTDKNYKIINKKIGKRIAVTSEITLTGLLLVSFKNNSVQFDRNNYSSDIVSSENDSNHSTSINKEDAYHRYYKIYNEIIQNLNIHQFDDKFLDIYNNGIIVIDGREYPIEKLRLRHLESGITHFTFPGKNHVDVFTGEYFDGREDAVCPFRNSSIFYQMYQDGSIQSKQIIVNKDIFQTYAKDWDKTIHTETPKLKAEVEANKIYRKKYGR